LPGEVLCAHQQETIEEENAMTQDIGSRRSGEQTRMTRRYPLKGVTLVCLAVAGLAGIIVATTPLTGRRGEVAAAEPARAEAAGPAAAAEAKVTPLFSKDLKDFPGKEGLMITVQYPPGCVDPVHRHNAHAFLYVLEGSIVMQVRGGKEVTLKPGDTFYEGPDDVHTVGRNASTTEPAKFVVFFVKDKGAPVLVPAK
jgi:quercetin dioxygenase-like cupin family protein